MEFPKNKGIIKDEEMRCFAPFENGFAPFGYVEDPLWRRHTVWRGLRPFVGIGNGVESIGMVIGWDVSILGIGWDSHR